MVETAIRREQRMNEEWVMLQEMLKKSLEKNGDKPITPFPFT
jgi:hypothetical protein